MARPLSLAQSIGVLGLIGSGNHVDFKKGYSPKESAFVFQEKKKKNKSGKCQAGKNKPCNTCKIRH